MDKYLPMMVAAAALGCSDEPASDTGEQPWWATDTIAASPWSVAYGVGARGGVAVGADGTLAVGDPDGRVYIGDPLGDLPSIHDVGADNPSLTPVLHDDAVAVRGTDGTLLALDPATGEVLWESVDHMPVLAGGRFVMQRNTTDPAVRARDPVTGDVLWTQEDDTVASRPVHALGDRVCGVSVDWEVSLFDASDGSEVYRVQPGLEDPGRSIYTCEVLPDGGVLVFGSVDPDGGTTELVRYSATGEELARHSPFDGSAPAFRAVMRDDGRVVVWGQQQTEVLDADLVPLMTWDDRVPRAVDPRSGNMLYGWTLVDSEWDPIWTAEVGVPVHAYRLVNAVVVDETVYVTDTQEGVLGGDRWTRTVVLTSP